MLKKQGIAASREEMAKLAKEAKAAGVEMKQAGAKGAEAFSKALGPTKLMSSSVEQLRGVLLSTFGVGALAALATSSVVAFERIRQAMTGARLEMQRLGQGSAENVRELEDVMSGLSRLSGVARADLIPTYREMIRATKDHSEALGLTEVAAHLAAIQLGDLKEIGAVLSALWKGNLIPAAELFNVQLTDLEGNARPATAVMRDLSEAMQVASEQKAPVGWLQWLRDWRRSVAPSSVDLELMKQEAKIIDERAEAFRRLAERAKDAAIQADEKAALKQREELNRRLDAYVEKVERAAQEEVRRREDIERKAQDELLAIQVAGAERGSEERLRIELALLQRMKESRLAEAQAVGADTLAIEQAFDMKRRAMVEEFKNFRVQKNQEALDSILLAEKNTMDAIARMNEEGEKQEQELRDLEISMLEDHDQQKLDLKLEDLKKKRQEELKAAEGNERAIAAINRKYDKLEQKAHEELEKANARVSQARLDSVVAASEKYAAAAMVISGVLFGESKAAAIAEALINTYVGATKALAQFGPILGPIMAAVIIAAGMQQVSKIKSTKPESKGGKGGGTFDDPTNDAIAAAGGRKSAEDFVRLTSSGFQRGLGQAILGAPSGPGEPAMAGEASYTVNINGNVYGGDAGMRQLRRELELAERRDRPGRER